MKKDFTKDGITYEVWYSVISAKTNGERDPRYQEVIADGFVDITDVHRHDPELEEMIEPTVEEIQWLVKQVEKAEGLVVS